MCPNLLFFLTIKAHTVPTDRIQIGSSKTMKLQDRGAWRLLGELGMLSHQADFFRWSGNYNSAYRVHRGGRALVEFRMLPQPMGPRGRLSGLLIGGAGRRASRGPREGAAEVQVGEAGLRRALRVSSCSGGIQRRCLQFQPVALLFSCTNVVMPKRKVSLTEKDFKGLQIVLPADLVIAVDRAECAR